MPTKKILADIAAQHAETDTSKGYSGLVFWASRYIERSRRGTPRTEDRADLVKAAAMLVHAIEILDAGGTPTPPPEEPTPETPES